MKPIHFPVRRSRLFQTRHLRRGVGNCQAWTWRCSYLVRGSGLVAVLVRIFGGAREVLGCKEIYAGAPYICPNRCLSCGAWMSQALYRTIAVVTPQYYRILRSNTRVLLLCATAEFNSIETMSSCAAALLFVLGAVPTAMEPAPTTGIVVAVAAAFGSSNAPTRTFATTGTGAPATGAAA